jgi:uncharacterized protein (DUF1499 family)
MSHALVALSSLAIVVVASVLVLALQVEDWRRDLVTNVAETDPAHPDPLLRPLTVSLSVPETVALVERSVRSLPRWQVTGANGDSAAAELHLVRTSRLFRFGDDVTVWIDRRAAASVIRARSASRVGKGDLGQNPRNLRQLMQAIRDEVDAARRAGAD